MRYQEVDVTLSAATFSRLEQGNPFNKRRVADQAIEVIRVALYTMYPPRTPEEWKDRSRFQGARRQFLLVCYDSACYMLHKLVGRGDENKKYAKACLGPTYSDHAEDSHRAAALDREACRK
jgi:hypothetical protein